MLGGVRKQLRGRSTCQTLRLIPCSAKPNLNYERTIEDSDSMGKSLLFVRLHVQQSELHQQTEHSFLCLILWSLTNRTPSDFRNMC